LLERLPDCLRQRKTALIQFTREKRASQRRTVLVSISVDIASHIPLRYLTSAVNGNGAVLYTSRRLQNGWESSPWADDPFNYTGVALKCRPVEEFLNYDWDWDWDWEALLLSRGMC
jgi:hypothetical protein